MKRAILWWLAVLAVAVVAQAQVAPPPGAAPASASPYAATVPVAGTSDAQRSAAIGDALTQVLQRVAPGFVGGPDVLAQAPGYVRNFQYQRAASGTGLQLQVEFDPGAISRLVAASTPVAAGTPPAAGTASAAAAPAAGASTGSAVAGGAVSAGTGTVWVDGLVDGHAWVTLLAELRGDAALHDVIPVAAAGDGVLLRLRFDQPLAGVLAALETPTGHLAQATTPHPGADATLRWVP